MGNREQKVQARPVSKAYRLTQRLSAYLLLSSPACPHVEQMTCALQQEQNLPHERSERL